MKSLTGHDKPKAFTPRPYQDRLHDTRGNKTMNAENDGDATTKMTAAPRMGIRDLHVKAIPESVWIRARCKTTQSGLSFKEYLIRLLGASQPLTEAKPSAFVG
jgi:hypothetical protein